MMQLKFSRDIEWADLPRIESPFFACGHVERAFYADPYGMDAVAGIDDVIHYGLPGHFGPRRDAAALDWMLRRVEDGLVVLVHGPYRRPFQPVLRWEKNPDVSVGHPPRPGLSPLHAHLANGQADAGSFATRKNSAQQSSNKEDADTGHWIVAHDLPGPARWPIEDWLVKGRHDAALNRGKPESDWWDGLMGGRREAKGSSAQAGAAAVSERKMPSDASAPSFVERVLPEGAPIVRMGKAFGGVAAAVAGWIRGDEELYNTAIDGLRETQSENVETAILLGTMGRGAANGGLRTSAVISAERAETFLVKKGMSADRAADFVASFDGPITARLVRPGENFLRYTDAANSTGSFVTKTSFPNPAAAIDGLYLGPYGNGASLMQSVTSMERSIVLEGAISNGGAGVRQSIIIDRGAFQFGTGAGY